MRLGAITVAGGALFLWPFSALGPPGAAVSTAVALGGLLALISVEILSRRLDARRLAVLAAIAAIDSALRMALVNGIGGFSPVFLLILCAGYAMGAEFGFVCGASTLLLSALVTAGVGPWLPYEMIAAGWVGAAAGLAGSRRRQRSAPGRSDVLILMLVGIAAGYAYGAVMDLWDWSYFRGAAGVGYLPGAGAAANAARFGRFYLATSLVYDSFRAAGNAILVVLLATPVLGALARLRRRFHVEIVEAPLQLPLSPPLRTERT